MIEHPQRRFQVGVDVTGGDAQRPPRAQSLSHDTSFSADRAGLSEAAVDVVEGALILRLRK
ncbi:hypothetical protein, partial [Brooklawnia cerclae]